MGVCSRARRRTGALILGALVVSCSTTPPPPPDDEIVIEPDEEFVWVAGPISDSDLDELRKQACVTDASPILPEAHVVELVVDVSGSMSLPPATGTEVKWDTTREALRAAAERLPDTTHLGALYFPNRATERNCLSEEEVCVPGQPLPIESCLATESAFPITPLGPLGSQSRLQFEESLDAVNPAGGTPTHDAFNWAFATLESAPPDIPRFIVLITDGQPTFLEDCVGSGDALDPVDEEPLLLSISSANQQGVPTFVIGSPGSESHVGTGEDARPWLSRAAISGGTAAPGCTEASDEYCHFDLSEEDDFESGLERALDQVLGRISPCTFTLPASPAGQTIDPDLLNVILHDGEEGAEVIGRAQSMPAADEPPEAPALGGASFIEPEACGEGWTSSTEGTIELCEETCGRLRESSRASVELLFGCEAVPVIPPK